MPEEDLYSSLNRYHTCEFNIEIKNLYSTLIQVHHLQTPTTIPNPPKPTKLSIHRKPMALSLCLSHSIHPFPFQAIEIARLDCSYRLIDPLITETGNIASMPPALCRTVFGKLHTGVDHVRNASTHTYPSILVTHALFLLLVFLPPSTPPKTPCQISRTVSSSIIPTTWVRKN